MDNFNKDDILAEIEKLEGQMNDVPFTVDELVEKIVINGKNIKMLLNEIENQNNVINQQTTQILGMINANTELNKHITDIYKKLNKRTKPFNSGSDEYESQSDRRMGIFKNEFKTTLNMTRAVAFISLGIAILSLIF
jgi:septal ring factor EnvC (AmiA/AmiB activator)